MGWPPRWVRDQPESNNSNQRALPPVPSGQTGASGISADHIPDEDERVSTPELRPEDFPPGKHFSLSKNQCIQIQNQCTTETVKYRNYRNRNFGMVYRTETDNTETKLSLLYFQIHQFFVQKITLLSILLHFCKLI